MKFSSQLFQSIFSQLKTLRLDFATWQVARITGVPDLVSQIRLADHRSENFQVAFQSFNESFKNFRHFLIHDLYSLSDPTVYWTPFLVGSQHSLRERRCNIKKRTDQAIVGP